jgi:uncharacterized protein YbcI
MIDKTRGQIEADISDALVKFEKEYMGRGPQETQTHLIGDMIISRLKGVLTPAEEQLAKSEEGASLIKKIRDQLIESARLLLETIVVDITGCQLVSLHSDISTKTGERIIIFIVNADLESQLRGPERR